VQLIQQLKLIEGLNMRLKNIISISLVFVSLPLVLLLALSEDIEASQQEKAMVFSKLTPNLMVEDVNNTIEFYKNILGFELVMTVPEEGTFDFALMKSGNVEIMFQSRESLSEDFRPEFKNKKTYEVLTLYVDMENIEGLLHKINDKVTIIKDLHTTFYGTQEFAIKDCNGYILTFAEGGN